MHALTTDHNDSALQHTYVIVPQLTGAALACMSVSEVADATRMHQTSIYIHWGSTAAELSTWKRLGPQAQTH